MNPQLEFLTKTIYDPATFWAMVAAVAATLLLGVAFWQLRSLAKTSRSDFLYRLKSDFFTKEARKLIFLADEGLLKFHDTAKIPYFEVLGRDDPAVAERMKEMDIDSVSISTYEVDDTLLGPMEDVGVFEKLGQVNLNEVYDVFVTYLDICVESAGLKEYLEWSRKESENHDVWENLLNLYRKLEKKSRGKRNS